jgi:hypothetical protein
MLQATQKGIFTRNSFCNGLRGVFLSQVSDSVLIIVDYIGEDVDEVLECPAVSALCTL